MPVHYHIDPSRDLLVGDATGAVTAQEFKDAADEIVTATSGAALHKNVLIIINESTGLHNIDLVALNEIRDQMIALSREYPVRKVRTALVAGDSVRTAVLKLWQATTDAHPEIGTTVQIFNAEGPAIRWLKE